jgi:ferrous iron transport protein A
MAGRTRPLESYYNEINSHLETSAIPVCPLNDLPRHTDATIREVVARGAQDPIALRLAELGFVEGEPVRVVAHGPVGGDPLLVQIGYTRFALRRAEAARVVVESA